VVTLVPSLVDAVAGAPVRGSWWGHPEGKRIFQLATAIEESGEVVVAKLVEGRVTFVHRALWPALARVVTDAGWRRRRAAGLDAVARDLLRRVERAGELRFAVAPADARRRWAAARRALEARALVLSGSEHTEGGKHLPVLRSWNRWAADAAVAPAMPLDQALAELAAKGLALG
jgi:hypothetical protein